jgi:hypothetical protein
MEDKEKGILALAAGAAVAVVGYFLWKKKAGGSDEPISLSGQVISTYSNEGLPGIEITVGDKTVATDLLGKYKVTEISGTVNVSVNDPDYVPYTNRIALRDGANVLDIGLIPLAVLTGTVTDQATGGYIAGVTVTAQGLQNYSAITNASGQYSMTVPFGNYNVTAAKSGYQPQTLPRLVVPPTTVLSFDLAQQYTDTGTVMGRVTNANNGNGIVGATVTVGPYPVTTGFDGGYQIEVPTGTYDIYASAEGYNQASRLGYVVRVGTVNYVDFALTPIPVAPGSLTGRITEVSNGNIIGVYGATVVLNETAPGGAGPSRTTNNLGYYLFQSLEPGVYDVTAKKEGYSSKTEQAEVFSDSQTTLDITLTRGTQLGFVMEVVDNLNLYPQAEFWYGDINGSVTNLFVVITSLWDERSVDMDAITWPATLTVELYTANLDLIVRRVITVERMYNGHYYTFRMDALPHLVDQGPY